MLLLDFAITNRRSNIAVTDKLFGYLRLSVGASQLYDITDLHFASMAFGDMCYALRYLMYLACY